MSALVNEITLNESEETPLPSLLQVKHCFCWSCGYFCQHSRSSPRSPADNNDNNAKNVRQRPRVHRLVVHPLANPTGLQHVSSTEIKFASLDVDAKKYLMPKDTRIFFKSHVKNVEPKNVDECCRILWIYLWILLDGKVWRASESLYVCVCVCCPLQALIFS